MKQYLIGLDTETCNNPLDDKGRVQTHSSLVYDIGWVVTDRDGNIYHRRSFVIEEIFNQCADIMDSAYFAEKIPQYKIDIENGTRKLVSIWEARDILLRDMLEFKTRIVFAHNTAFDVNALNATIRYITTSRVRYFFNYYTTFWDTISMWNSVMVKKKKYIKFCEENGYMTNHRTPRPRVSAEVVYRYITNDNDFVESHTGLEDIEIETQILVHCFKQHKKMDKEVLKKKYEKEEK